MEFNLQANSQEYSNLDSWIDDGRTSASTSLHESGLESKSSDSLRLHPVNLNPDARPFRAFETPDDLTIKITPSSHEGSSHATDEHHQRYNIAYNKQSQDSYDNWYQVPNNTPLNNNVTPKYQQQQQLMHQHQQPQQGMSARGGGAGNQERFASYNNMISSLGQFESPQQHLYQSGSNSAGGGNNYGVSRVGSVGYSPHSMSSISHESDYGNMGRQGMAPRPMGGGMGSNKTSPSYGAAVAASQYASGGSGVYGGSPSYQQQMNKPINSSNMNNYRTSPQAGGGGNMMGSMGGMPPRGPYGASAMHHQPSYGGMGGMGGMGGDMQGTIYEVQFKAAFRYFVMDPMNPVEAGVGEFVIVEGDRGEDLGIVTQTMSMMAFIELKCAMNNSSLDEHENSVKRILRVASTYERQQLPSKYYDEQQIIEYCNELISAKYQIPLIIVNAEYQFDRNKITLYYDASTRIDFRELVRDLYSTFKTRIWMKQVDDHKPFYPLQFATMSLATGAQFSPGTVGGQGNASNNNTSGGY